MKYLICLLCVLLITLSCQIGGSERIENKKCTVPIFIDEYKRYFNFSEYISDTIIINPTESKRAKIILYDCKGGMLFQGFKNNLLYVKGEYISANKLTTINVTQEDLFNPGVMKDVKEKVYIPLRNGEWNYYDEGKLILKKTYNLGILIKTDSIK